MNRPREVVISSKPVETENKLRVRACQLRDTHLCSKPSNQLVHLEYQHSKLKKQTCTVGQKASISKTQVTWSIKRKLTKARADQSWNEWSVELGMKPYPSKQLVLQDPDLWAGSHKSQELDETQVL